jgi:hypothetical protein
MENVSNAEEAAAQQGWSVGMIIGVAAGGAAAVGLVLLGLWWRWSWQQKQKRLQVSSRHLSAVLARACNIGWMLAIWVDLSVHYVWCVSWEDICLRRAQQ